jgi:hypothetical protein
MFAARQSVGKIAWAVRFGAIMASSRKRLHLFCKVLGLFICVSVRTALADVSIESGLTGYKINIFGTISRDDATKLAQREAELELGVLNPEVFLNSTGGDVDAAMSIGRIVRRIDGFTRVERNAHCYSSCALIYIAGVDRYVGVDLLGTGLIGLHRPYFASFPQARAVIEREAPQMLQSLKRYIEEMGLSDSFYNQMVTTEPSSMVLYGDSLCQRLRACTGSSGYRDIYRLVPQRDPTFDEIEVAYDARWYGIDTAEMRRRAAAAESCGIRDLDCKMAAEWGLSMADYRDRWNRADAQCPRFSDVEGAVLKSVKRRDSRDHPIYLKREACVRKIMVGQ